MPTMTIPILIGYFPKRTLKRPDWIKAAGVDEVCSVSTCISAGPAGWINQWLHNEMWVYETPELAWSVVPQNSRGEFDLYAYQMFPVQFDDGQQKPFEIPPLCVAPLSAAFEFFGLDVVSRSCGSAFECSPLSCNLRAEDVPVTRHCLIADHGLAIRLAEDCEAGGGEPGPHFAVEVWRLKRDSVV